jgi:hypothetical protein
VLLEKVVHSRKCQQELLRADLLRLVLDVKVMERLGLDGLAHVSFERKVLVRDGIKPGRCWDLAFVLQNDGQDNFFADSYFLEAQCTSAISLSFGRLLDLKSRKSAFASELKREFILLRLFASVLNNALKYGTVLHHGCWEEAHSDVLVLVRVDCKAFRLHVKCKPFTLACSTWLDTEFDGARDLIGIDDLELFAHAFRVLLSNHSTEPEKFFLD